MQRQPKLFLLEPAFSDERGEITNIIEFMAFEHVALITCNAGALRGNHYHPEDDQWIYMLEGKAYVRTIDVVSEVKMGYVFEAGQLEYMPPGLAHVYYFPVDSAFLNITPQSRRTADNEERENATIKWKVWDGPPLGPDSAVKVLRGGNSV